jgi:hypothetical protein
LVSYWGKVVVVLIIPSSWGSQLGGQHRTINLLEMRILNLYFSMLMTITTWCHQHWGHYDLLEREGEVIIPPLWCTSIALVSILDKSHRSLIIASISSGMQSVSREDLHNGELWKIVGDTLGTAATALGEIWFFLEGMFLL